MVSTLEEHGSTHTRAKKLDPRDSGDRTDVGHCQPSRTAKGPPASSWSMRCPSELVDWWAFSCAPSNGVDAWRRRGLVEL